MTPLLPCSALRGRASLANTDCLEPPLPPRPMPFELLVAAPWSEEERLASEYAMLGFLRFPAIRWRNTLPV